MKKRYITLTIAVVLLIILVSLFIIYKPIQQTTYFYSDNIGIIEVTNVQHNFFSKLFNVFEQAVVFSEAEINLGQSVTLRDDYKIPTFGVLNIGYTQAMIGPCRTTSDCPTGYSCIDTNCITNNNYYEYIDYYNIVIDNKIVSSNYYSRLYGPGELLWSKYTWTPTKVGTFNAETQYNIVRCLKPAIPSLGIAPSGCSSSIAGCKFESDCTITDPSKNSVTVIGKNPPITCTKVAEWKEEFFDNTANGKIHKLTFNSVTSSCEYEVTATKYKYICDDGYGIDGTSSPTAEGQQHTCDRILVGGKTPCTDNSNCNAPDKCNPITNVCDTINCDAAQRKNCNDGTSILIKDCINGFQVDPKDEQICGKEPNPTPNPTLNPTPTNEVDYILLILIGVVIAMVVVGIIIVKNKK